MEMLLELIALCFLGLNLTFNNGLMTWVVRDISAFNV